MIKNETPDDIEDRIERAKIVNQQLTKLFPEPKVELNYFNVWELLVAVQLSAQCTDVRVNIVTKDLFQKYKTISDYVSADLEEFTQDINTINFYKNKAKNILAAAKLIHNSFGGVVPKTMKELLTVPGIARKSANVILNDGYDIQEGIIVDTHVIRLANKFKLTDEKDPVKIERDLMEIVPKTEWKYFSHRLVHYGRRVSKAHQVGSDEDPVSQALLWYNKLHEN